MKKLVLLSLSLFTVLLLSACGDLCVGPECVAGDGPDVENVILYTHINGHGEETEKQAFVLFEAELRDYVKYQVAYLSCTCRDSIVNYWNVMYIEVEKYSHEVLTISFGEDSEGHYTPGTWGDSSGDPNQAGITFEQFESDFIPWLVGKTPDDLAGIYVFDNDGHLGVTNDVDLDQDLVDAFAGSSVSTNNMIRIVKEILIYHGENYD